MLKGNGFKKTTTKLAQTNTCKNSISNKSNGTNTGGVEWVSFWGEQVLCCALGVGIRHKHYVLEIVV